MGNKLTKYCSSSPDKCNKQHYPSEAAVLLLLMVAAVAVAVAGVAAVLQSSMPTSSWRPGRASKQREGGG